MSEGQKQRNKRRFMITSIVIAIVLTFLIGSFFPVLGDNSIDKKSAIQYIASNAAKTFDFNFMSDHNFTSGMGEWFNHPASGGWGVFGNEAVSTIESTSIMYDPTNWTEDLIMSWDFIMPHSDVDNTSAGLEVIFHFNGVWGEAEAGATQYRLILSASGVPSAHPHQRGVTISKYIDGVLQTNWYFPTTYTDFAGQPSIYGTAEELRLYNDTWMRGTAGIIGNNLFITWGNLTGNNTNTLRMAVMDIGTLIPAGFIGFRSYATKAHIRNVQFYEPDISIALRSGQSATVHFTSNTSGYAYSGSPLKGVLSNNNWTISTSNSDIGTYSQFFTMTSPTTTIMRKIVLSIFPDVTVPGYWYDGPASSAQWYPGNPVIPNQPGAMSEQIYDPSIILDDDGYLKMWCSVNEPAVGQRTYFFESADGISWGTNGWTNPLTNPPLDYQKVAVIKVGGVYKMLVNRMDWTAGLYYFTSLNGYDWTAQNGGNPVLTLTLPWEGGAMSSPSINYLNGQFYVTYAISHSFGNIYEPLAYGGAHGVSLMSLTKYPEPLRLTSYDSKGNFSLSLGGLKPTRFGNSWIALANGESAQGFFQTSLAMSDDFLNWTAYPDYPAFPRYVDPINQSWANSHTYTGAIVVGHGADNLGFWFNADSGTTEQIGFVSWGFEMPSDYYRQTHAQIDSMINLIIVMLTLAIAMSVVGFALKAKDSRVKKNDVIDIAIFLVISLVLLGFLIAFFAQY